jgi:hypothetical protein
MGAAIAVLCLFGLRYGRWYVTETRKGQWLEKRLGNSKAIWICRLVLLSGFVFGVGLACRLINPVN